MRIIQPVPSPDMDCIERYARWFGGYYDKQIKKFYYKINNAKYIDWFAHQKTDVKRHIEKFRRDGYPKMNAFFTYQINPKTDELVLPECFRTRAIQAPNQLDKYFSRGLWNIQQAIKGVDYSMGGSYNWEKQALLLEKIVNGVRNPIFINGDLSCNDATLSGEEKIRTECAAYAKLYPYLGCGWTEGLNYWLRSKGVKSKQICFMLKGRNPLRFKLVGCRNTGELGTYLNNTEDNLAKLRWLLTDLCNLKEVEIEVIDGDLFLIEGGDFGIILCGDDFILVITEDKLSIVTENWNQVFAANRNETMGLGHWFKEGLGRSKYAEFCSRDAIQRTDGSFRWVRKPKRFLCFTPFTLSVRWNDKRPDICKYILKQLAYQEGIGIIRWAKGLPIFDTYARTLMRLGESNVSENIVEMYFDKWERRSIGEVFDFRADDWWLTCDMWLEKYGITTDTILAAEEALRNCNSLSDIIILDSLKQFHLLDSDGLRHYQNIGEDSLVHYMH
jgi:hypothetical protein